MSYIIDFYISCPMCLPETSPRLHAEIQMVQGPGQTPAFSYPSGCPASMAAKLVLTATGRFSAGFNLARSIFIKTLVQ